MATRAGEPGTAHLDFNVSAELEGAPPADESFFMWINEVLEADGLGEDEPPDVARFRRFFMGETIERVDLIVYDSEGNEKKRFTLEGCKCTDSPLQQLSRGEPPFEEGEGIEVRPVALKFEPSDR